MVISSDESTCYTPASMLPLPEERPCEVIDLDRPAEHRLGSKACCTPLNKRRNPRSTNVGNRSQGLAVLPPIAASKILSTVPTEEEDGTVVPPAVQQEEECSHEEVMETIAWKQCNDGPTGLQSTGLQSNLNHLARAQDLLTQIMTECNISLAETAEPYWISDCPD
ncbi:hypothetical protein K0M31_006772 [Melipona bicolor]|uniref:Uncharacterized protein n=1 Tax=Melipona bicolor TaxID=60889 RepID=A0AA40KL39_9HYME|nr:hypothetical protein K0M31_006772 [Melipona bicolor]